MWQELRRQMKPTLMMLTGMTVLTGIAYPFLMTGLAQTVFHRQANGSLVRREGRIIGSELIGQPFVGAGYFWSRPSATSPTPCNAASSSGSNLGPTNPSLTEAVEKRIAALRAAGADAAFPVPVDLVTASASGLDPDITPEAALFQVKRVARARGLSEEAVRRLAQDHVEPRTLGLFGEPRVNVLELNLALDKLAKGE